MLPQDNKQLGNTKALRHGHARPGKLTRTYRIWANIKTRCTNRNNPAFKDYGGRGVKLCERWMLFDNFLTDMGECPIGMQIDRIDNDLGYGKYNCRWTTATENSRNRRNTVLYDFNGERATLGALVAKYGKVCYGTAIDRLKVQGWSITDALLTPPIKQKDRKYVA